MIRIVGQALSKY